jgi:uncharacterized protein (TIGR00730 family)
MGLSVGLFCSASDRLPASAQHAATAFGAGVARAGWRLVYGGSERGLMGIASRAAMAAGGTVLGVMPRGLIQRERAAAQISELRIVETLAARKETMIAEADIFVGLPGGVGTLDELLEVITTFDIGLHAKPTVLCDIDGFWQPFVAMVQAFGAYGVLRPGVTRSFTVASDVEATLAACATRAEAAA